MKLRTLLLSSAVALMAATGGALAVDDAVIEDIADGLVAEGYTQMRVRHGWGWAEVEAWGPNGKLERRYDGDGDMLRERLIARDGTCDAECDLEPILARDMLRDQVQDGSGGGEQARIRADRADG